MSEINVAQPPLSHGSATLPRMGHLLGYARVSTTDQQPQLQVDALERAGCYRVFTETASGARPDRPTLTQLLDQLRPGDTLVVWKLDRLGRSPRHLVDTITGLADRGIGFRSLQEAIDTTTPGGKLDFMRSLGADQVIDYGSDDFTRSDEPYDLVLDLVAHRSPFACRRALAPHGRYWCVGGPVRTLLAIMTIGSIIGRLTRRRMGVLVVPLGPRYFTPLTDLGVAGDIGIHIDRTFGLDEVPEALRYVGEGLAHGKVVVTTD
jgi:Resolvase, N terminal domain/Zinc-binding dehydrogenase